ncbi:hypothetical protein AAV94_09865 [Lampropedia cohaerens]|uniref:Uncharacterized protein n=1 Tax=Lampropedia cohaerens TaxID=1610491 RepID=A0A0U1PYG0_9BURK|nr:hypothetical protein AAV94_09865 [Lampropedia cohaerens]
MASLHKSMKTMTADSDAAICDAMANCPLKVNPPVSLLLHGVRRIHRKVAAPNWSIQLHSQFRCGAILGPYTL